MTLNFFFIEIGEGIDHVLSPNGYSMLCQVLAGLRKVKHNLAITY